MLLNIIICVIIHGYECLELIKNNQNIKEIPVVIFTNSASANDRDRKKNIGAKAFITKTSDLNQMRLQLSKILKRELK